MAWVYDTQLSAFNSGVVIEGGQTVRVVLGEQGVDWDWQQGGDGRIQALHNDSTMATLQVRACARRRCTALVLADPVCFACSGAQRG